MQHFVMWCSACGRGVGVYGDGGRRGVVKDYMCVADLRALVGEPVN